MEPCADRNRAITGYSVRYGEVENGTLTTVTVTGASVMNTTISSLISSTNYSIEVAAVSSAGTGVYSDMVFTETNGKLNFV